MQVNQTHFIDETCARFLSKDDHPVSTPMLHNQNLRKPGPEDQVLDQREKQVYQELTAALNWAAQNTRPGI